MFRCRSCLHVWLNGSPALFPSDAQEEIPMPDAGRNKSKQLLAANPMTGVTFAINSVRSLVIKKFYGLEGELRYLLCI